MGLLSCWPGRFRLVSRGCLEQLSVHSRARIDASQVAADPGARGSQERRPTRSATSRSTTTPILAGRRRRGNRTQLLAEIADVLVSAAITTMTLGGGQTLDKSQSGSKNMDHSRPEPPRAANAALHVPLAAGGEVVVAGVPGCGAILTRQDHQLRGSLTRALPIPKPTRRI